MVFDPLVPRLELINGNNANITLASSAGMLHIHTVRFSKFPACLSILLHRLSQNLTLTLNRAFISATPEADVMTSSYTLGLFLFLLALHFSYLLVSERLILSMGNALQDSHRSLVSRASTHANIKPFPPILLILSLINVLLAAPVALQEVRQAYVDMADVPKDVIPMSESEKRSDELEKRWDKYSDEPWQERGLSSGSSPAPSVGEPPADKESAPSSPPSTQTGTSRIHDAASATSSPEIKRPPSDDDYPSSGESHLSDHGYLSSEDYQASDEGGPGSSKDFSDSSPDTGSPGSSMSHPPSDRPEKVSTPVLEPFSWNPHDWSTSSISTEPEPKKSFLSKLTCCYKIKFWPRGSRVL